jgi:hypothetical protein
MSPARKFRRVVACAGVLLFSPVVPFVLGYAAVSVALALAGMLSVLGVILAPLVIRCSRCRASLSTTLAEWRYGGEGGFWEPRPWALPDPPVCVRCKTSLWEP